jgi:hypothetical protein
MTDAVDASVEDGLITHEDAAAILGKVRGRDQRIGGRAALEHDAHEDHRYALSPNHRLRMREDCGVPLG